jgi:hypothetical protein
LQLNWSRIEEELAGDELEMNWRGTREEFEMEGERGRGIREALEIERSWTGIRDEEREKLQELAVWSVVTKGR